MKTNHSPVLANYHRYYNRNYKPFSSTTSLPPTGLILSDCCSSPCCKTNRSCIQWTWQSSIILIHLTLQVQFEDCKQRMMEYGEISRQLLLGLWYYLPTEREEFIDLYELISQFDLAYLVPQSEIPTSTTYCEPLLVSLNVQNNWDNVALCTFCNQLNWA